jgi:hypothetical protein
MKKLLCLLLLAAAGCTYPAYTVRKPLPTEPPMTRGEIERLSNAGISEPVMLELIEVRGANPLTTDDLVALKQAGAPDPVVQKAIASERKIVERVIVEDYYYPGYYPYYGTSFSYGIGWGYPYYGYGWGYGYCAPRGAMGVRVYR